jgi:transcriptional regulator with XRE-family HTH domain
MKKIYHYRAVGNRIKFLRGDDRTQEEFAAVLGVSLSAYQRYEHGERLPPLHVVTKLSKMCDVRVTWIISGVYVEGDKTIDGFDFYDAIDRLEYLYGHGSSELVELFKILLNYASNIPRWEFDNEEGADVIEFLTYINEASASKLRKIFKKRRDKISDKYTEEGEATLASYKAKTKKNKKSNQE